MPRGAYAHRIDENQAEIVKALRKVGATVLNLSVLGNGCPDLLVGLIDYKGGKHNILLEIKDGDKPTSKRKLTKAEQQFFDTWKGATFIINSVDEALHLYDQMKRLGLVLV